MRGRGEKEVRGRRREGGGEREVGEGGGEEEVGVQG